MNRSARRTAVCLATALVTTVIGIWMTTGIGGASTGPAPIGSLVPVTSPPIEPVPMPSSNTIQWITAPCANAEFGSVEHEPQLGLFISASARTCPPYKPGSAVAVATYRDDRAYSFVHGSNLVPYSPTGDTSMRILIRAATLRPGQGVCLIRTDAVRLVCGRTIAGPESAMTVEPIPVDDPLVDRPVIFDGNSRPEGEPMPGCATCVEAPS